LIIAETGNTRNIMRRGIGALCNEFGSTIEEDGDTKGSIRHEFNLNEQEDTLSFNNSLGIHNGGDVIDDDESSRSDEGRVNAGFNN
jgi:hypothetical protein